MKISIQVTLLLFFVGIFTFSGLAQDGSAKTSSRSKFHKKVYVAVERKQPEKFSVAFDFRGDGTIQSLGATEISVQMVAVKRTADGRVDDVTNVGSPSKIQLSSIKLIKEGEEQSELPQLTMQTVAGVDAISVSIRETAGGATKQFYLRLPAAGSTSGEIRF